MFAVAPEPAPSVIVVLLVRPVDPELVWPSEKQVVHGLGQAMMVGRVDRHGPKPWAPLGTAFGAAVRDGEPPVSSIPNYALDALRTGTIEHLRLS